MDEIRLVNILSSPSSNVKQPGITDSNSTNLPPVITRFPPGSILSGFIINRDPAGNPVLRTADVGDIAFQTKLFLKIGAEVVIKVENRTGQNVARIITVDGQPPPQNQPATVTSPSNFTAAQPPSQTPATAGQAAPPQTATTANVQTPAAQIATSNPVLPGIVTASNTPQLPQGTPLNVTLVSVTSPATPQQPVTQAPVTTAAPTNTAPPPASPATTTAPTAAQQTSTAPPPAPATNASDAAHYAAYKARPTAPTGQPPPAPATTPPPVAATATNPTSTVPQTPTVQTVQATVVAQTPTGGTVVQTASGLSIQLQTTQPLPQGSSVSLQVSPAPQQAGQPVASTPPLPAIASLTQRWPSLSSVLQLLSAELSADQIATSNFAWLGSIAQGSNAPPPTAQNISNGLIIFILALKSGDFRGWIGREAIQQLENKGHQALVKSAEGDFMALSRQFTDAQPGQWQSLFFPLAVHGEVQQLRFYLKRDRKKGAERDADDDTRFVIETELSQLGELQLDGFTRKQGKKLEFDLYIRTRHQLDEGMQRDIAAIYNNFGELTGYTGQLAFQTVEEFPVHPLHDIIHEDDVGDVIV